MYYMLQAIAIIGNALFSLIIFRPITISHGAAIMPDLTLYIEFLAALAIIIGTHLFHHPSL